jgi:hypothetical protein
MTGARHLIGSIVDGKIPIPRELKVPKEINLISDIPTPYQFRIIIV